MAERIRNPEGATAQPPGHRLQKPGIPFIPLNPAHPP
jgi:hypothetical protein